MPVAQPGICYFRHIFDIRAAAALRAATLVLAADNEFSAYVNGVEIGRGNQWDNLYTYALLEHLQDGENVLAVRVHNGGQLVDVVAVQSYWFGVGGEPARVRCREHHTCKGKVLVVRGPGCRSSFHDDIRTAAGKAQHILFLI